MKGHRIPSTTMKFEAKKDGSRWFVTTEDDAELKCSGRSLLEALKALPEKLEYLERRRIKSLERSYKHHNHLWSICQLLPEDYVPYGKVLREDLSGKTMPDCSSGCVYFYKISSKGKEKLYMDWGTCTNPKSHRKGLLTFEHQGCPHAVRDEHKRVYGSSPFATQPVDPEDEPDQQIPTNEANGSDRSEGNDQTTHLIASKK